MSVIRLVPSEVYNAAGTKYLTIQSKANMLTNTDSNTFGTIVNVDASTNSRYVYLRGFNFDDVPSNATVTRFTIKLKAKETGLSTSSSYRPRICDNTTTLVGSSSTIGTSFDIITFTDVGDTWDYLKSYGSDFGIRINVRRANKSKVGECSVCGAEIEVTYTEQIPHTVTTTLTGNGTIDPPAGTQTMYDGDTYDLTVTPTNAYDTVTATKNGSAITLTKHTGGALTDNANLGAYTLVSGGFSGSGNAYFAGLVGKGYDNTQTSSNYYSAASSIAVFTYDIPFTGIPSIANITRLYMRVNGHCESTSQSSEYMCVQLVSGDTALSDELNFKSVGTSNSTQTVTANVTPTVAQLENLQVKCRVGTYGGAINGATVYLEYEVSGVWYTYSTTISGDMTIAVTISAGTAPKIYLKVNGTWTQYSKVYLKVNGSWVEQSDLSSVFSSSANYVKVDP